MNYYNESVGAWFVVGVAWIGDRSDNCQFSGQPNIYARITYYIDWINVITGSSPDSSTVMPPDTTVNTNAPINFSCDDKPDGNYPNPAEECSSTFYMCSNGMPYTFVSSSFHITPSHT